MQKNALFFDNFAFFCSKYLVYKEKVVTLHRKIGT